MILFSQITYPLSFCFEGYKLRVELAKGLQRRSRVIRTAVAGYNSAALAMLPPKPTVDWDMITQHTFLEEFDVLKLSRNDISDKLWVQSGVRNIMRSYQKLLCAQEEVVRCNVEVHRLHTSITDENAHLRTTVCTLSTDDAMYAYVSDYVV